ncbi:hypothetical protein [Chroococcidiopsis sp.]|uniref:hypothetical protein n=1 Tax=Chroococcidiopsis sp. TaxID=3088168 RepID=UPI003F3600D9
MYRYLYCILSHQDRFARCQQEYLLEFMVFGDDFLTSCQFFREQGAESREQLTNNCLHGV